MKLALAALLLLAGPALADDTLPPPEFDVGGATEAEVIVNVIDRFGLNAPEMIRVPFREALAKCNEVQMEKLGTPYPAAEVVQPGHILIGCYIHDWYGTEHVVVYSGRTQKIATEILRHEVGHMLGWHTDHRRN